MKITAIKQQVKRSDRYSVFVDGAYAFGLSEAGLIEQGLASGQELDAQQLSALKRAAGLDKAYNNALRFVALRPRSEWELAQYCKRKGLDDAAARHITERLRALGLLDDQAFAEAWVANRRLLKPVSKRRLLAELKQKHVAEDIITAVLAADPANERDTLRQLVKRKRQQTRYQDPAKLLQYLARQGYRYDDITAVLGESEPV